MQDSDSGSGETNVRFESVLFDFLGAKNFFGDDSNQFLDILGKNENYRKINDVFETADFLEMGLGQEPVSDESQLADKFHNIFDVPLGCRLKSLKGQPADVLTNMISTNMNIYLKFARPVVHQIQNTSYEYIRFKKNQMIIHLKTLQDDSIY